MLDFIILYLCVSFSSEYSQLVINLTTLSGEKLVIEYLQEACCHLANQIAMFFQDSSGHLNFNLYSVILWCKS